MKIVLLGPPGAGKGTLSTKISKDYQVLPISTGDIFRAAIEKGTILGKKVQELVDNGQLVPDELTINLVKERLLEEDALNGYILDGFPRTIAQADALSGFGEIDFVVNLDITDDSVIIERLSGRRTCDSCKAIYHIKYNPPKTEGLCDKCGGHLSIREDDEISAIQKRLLVYKEKTKPLIEYYSSRKLIKNIDSSRTPEQIYEDFKKIAETY